MGAKRGSRGGKRVQLKRIKEEEKLFRDKCDEIELKLGILCLEFKLFALSDFSRSFNHSEMPVLENTPKVTKARGPMPVLRCEISNCSFTCKYKKHMREHQSAVHEIDAKADDSVLDKSVEIEINAGDISNITSNSAENSQDEERKAHSSMDARPHSTLNVVQACPLEEETDKEETKKRHRSGSDDEEEEDSKREKIEDYEPAEVLDPSPPSPNTANRQRIVAEAKLLAEEIQLKAEEAERKKSMDDQAASIMKLLQDSDDSGETSTSKEDETLNESRSLLEVTVRQRNEEEEDDIVDNTFALSQEQNMSVMEDPVKDLQDELALRTKSLQDALGENDTLKTRLAAEVNRRELAENKVAKQEKELTDNLGVIQSLSLACRTPHPPQAAKTSKEDEIKMNRLKEENNSLLAKLNAKKKEIESLKLKLKDERDAAASSNRLAMGFEQQLQETKGELARMKSLTHCTEVLCTDEKVCGRSHKKKPENRGPCSYFMAGYCRHENRCTHIHDTEARNREWAARHSGQPQAPPAAQPAPPAPQIQSQAPVPDQAPPPTHQLQPLNPPQQPCGGHQGYQVQPPHHQGHQGQGPVQGGGCHQRYNGNTSRRGGKRGRGGNGGVGSTRPKSANGGSEYCTNQGTPQAYGPPQSSHHHHQPSHLPQPPPHQPQQTQQPQQPHQPYHQPPPPTQQAPQVSMPPPVQPPTWQTPSVAQLTAVQATEMTRNQRLEELRIELGTVQSQIANVRYHPPGSVNMATLFQKEAELRTRMYNM